MAKALLINSDCLEGMEGQGTDALDHVRRGGVVIFRDCLRQIGYAEKLRELTLAEMRLHCKAEEIHEVESKGFEKIHHILSARQIYDINVGLTERMKLVIGSLIGAFTNQILGHRKRVYVFGLPVVRFFVPHDVFSANRDLFSKRQGFLQIQGPHHDTWFDHATESLNVWIAIGRVRRGNGLIIYPDRTQQNYLHHDGSRAMPRKEFLGRSISFDLEPGDILFFHGETLHSSELNVTDDTRYVVTNRFTLSKPSFKEHEQWQTWLDSKLLGTAFEKLAVWPTYFSKDYLRHKLTRNKLTRKFYQSKHQEIAKRGGKHSGESDSAEDLQGAAVIPVDLGLGKIRAISKDRCVLKSEKGIVEFSRFCPHEGADLANATYKDGRIQCPWHHLSFDAETGRQPCQSLKNLKVYPQATSSGAEEEANRQS